MTDSGNSPTQYYTVPLNRRIRQVQRSQVPVLTYVEEIESPAILSDQETESPFVSEKFPSHYSNFDGSCRQDGPTEETLATTAFPSLFAIHNQQQPSQNQQNQQQQQKQQTDYDNYKCLYSGSDSDADLAPELTSTTDQMVSDFQKKRKADETSPSIVQGQLKSPAFTKTKSKSILFPLETEGNLYERDNVPLMTARASKKQKLNKYEKQDSQSEHEVPSTPPPCLYDAHEFSNKESKKKYKEEEEEAAATASFAAVAEWESEMSKVMNVNKQLTTELQTQIQNLISLVPKLQKTLKQNVSRETAATLVLKTIEKVNHKLEGKLNEYNHSLKDLQKSSPKLFTRLGEEQTLQQEQEAKFQQQQQQQQPELEKEDEDLNDTDNDADDDDEPEQPENERSEEEFQELESRISSLEQELSESRQFITILGNKVLEMEAKVFSE